MSSFPQGRKSISNKSLALDDFILVNCNSVTCFRDVSDICCYLCIMCASLTQFQALLHPKAECSSGVTFCFCYQLICHLFFLPSGLLVPYEHEVSIFVTQTCLQIFGHYRQKLSPYSLFRSFSKPTYFRIIMKIQNYRLFYPSAFSLTYVSSRI